MIITRLQLIEFRWKKHFTFHTKKREPQVSGELVYLNGKVPEYTHERDSMNSGNNRNKEAFYIRKGKSGCQGRIGCGVYIYCRFVIDTVLVLVLNICE